MEETIVTDPPADPEIKKDSRQSWLVCIAASLLAGFSVVVNHGFGVLFVHLVDEFDEGRAKIGKCIYNTVHYYMTIFVSGAEREIQQFDWLLGAGLKFAVPNR